MEKAASSVKLHPDKCECPVCLTEQDFKLDNSLVDEIDKGNAVIFAGAGISTESRMVCKHTFYEEIMLDMLCSGHPALYQQKEEGKDGLSFADLMTAYSDQPNGRYKLLSMLKKRFATIDAFPELYRQATKFHQELGTLFPIKTIITTNWDEYFERECKATPFVFDQDMAFWDAADRRVLKIHGSIASFGSIIADNEDYRKCKKSLERGVIGGLLKTVLATKTVIFIGYSLSDYDFNSIYGFVKKQMKNMLKQAYIVTPMKADAEKFKKMGFQPIITGGAYFIEKIKEHKKISEHFVSDEVFKFVWNLLVKANNEHVILHKRVKFAEFPHAIFSAYYQDGLIHALERALAMRGSGQYSHLCALKELIAKYEKRKEEKISRKSFGDAAYIEGYVNGLVSMVSFKGLKIENVPMYFGFSAEFAEWNIDQYLERLPELAVIHPESLAWAAEAIGMLPDPVTTEWHHPPWL